MKRQHVLGAGALATVLLLAGSIAWTAPRQPRQSSGDDAAKEVVLIAPTGARLSVEKLAPDFQAKTGYKIKGSYAASGLAKKKVIDGEPVDVAILLLPIDDAYPSGNLVQSSVTPLATVPIALAVKKGAPQPDISTPEALKQTLLAATAIAYPHGAHWRRIRAQRGRHAHQAGDHGSNDAQNQSRRHQPGDEGRRAIRPRLPE